MSMCQAMGPEERADWINYQPLPTPWLKGHVLDSSMFASSVDCDMMTYFNFDEFVRRYAGPHYAHKYASFFREDGRTGPHFWRYPAFLQQRHAGTELNKYLCARTKYDACGDRVGHGSCMPACAGLPTPVGKSWGNFKPAGVRSIGIMTDRPSFLCRIRLHKDSAPPRDASRNAASASPGENYFEGIWEGRDRFLVPPCPKLVRYPSHIVGTTSG